MSKNVETNLYRFFNEDCIEGSRKWIADGCVDLIITDPPYGIEGDKLHRHYNRDERFVLDGYIEVPKKEYGSFSAGWIREAYRILRPGGGIYIISGYSNLSHILNALRQTSLKEINHLIWKYNFGVYTLRKYISSHYHILYYVKPGARHTFNTFIRFAPEERDNSGGSLNYQDREDVWTINRQYKPGRLKNKNELPAELLTKMMLYSSNEGDLVCDFFLGGFSTAMVAIGLNRRIIGFELSPKAFKYGLKLIEDTEPGYLLIKELSLAEPSKMWRHSRKRWSSEEKRNLFQRFNELSELNLPKHKVIERLGNEFERGRFSIERILKQQGKDPTDLQRYPQKPSKLQ